MQQIPMITFGILALGAMSQTDCDYGQFVEVNGECKYNCEYADDYISYDELSFTSIKDQCQNVRLANEAYPSSCNSINDLVWRNDSCECPYCKCSDTSSTKDIEDLSYFAAGPRANCYNVECEDLGLQDSGIKDMVFTYSEWWNDAYSWFDWIDYGTCPPQRCYDISSHSYYSTVTAGTYWWASGGDSDTQCTEFCYCTSNGETVCENGWDAIMDNDGVKDSFMRDCGGYRDSAAVK